MTRQMPVHMQLAMCLKIMDECRYAAGSDTAKRIAEETLPMPARDRVNAMLTRLQEAEVRV